nr:hypothetical protein [Tanacetum cinerariifolium]
MAFTSSSSSSSDNEVASCSKTCTKSYATLQSHYDKLTNDLKKSQFDVLSYKTGLESVKSRILVYQQNETIFKEDIKLLKLDVKLRDNALVELRKKFEKAELERDELKLKLDKFQTSSKNLSQLLASQTSDKTRLGYNNQFFNSSVFDCDEMFSFKSDVSMPSSPVYDRYKSGQGYHVVPPSYTGTFMPSKLDLVFHDAPTVNETGNPQHALKDKGVLDSGCSRHMTRNMPYLFDFDEIIGGYVAFGGNPKGGKITGKDSLLPIPFWTEAINTACYVQNRVLVTKPQNKTPYELLLGRTPSIGFMRLFGYPVTILNTLDPLGKFDGKADEGFLVGYSISSKAFRIFNSRTKIVQETLHIIFLENQPYVAGSGPTWLFDIDTLTKSMNYQPVLESNQPNSSAGIQEHFDPDKAGEGNVQQYVLFPLWSSGSKSPQNINDDATFEIKKPKSEVHVSPSSSAKTQKHDEKTNKEAKGKSPVKFTPVSVVGQNLTNSTNTFSAVGPSNTVVSPTLGKSSYVDPSQYLDDPNMPALEDITYFDDEEEVGAEADFSNLETITQTRSMTRMVKDQGGLTQINNKDFHTCMFACFLSQEEPKRVHQDLKDPSWIEAMQEELLQFKMQKGQIDQTLFIKKQKADILLVQVYVDDIIFGSTNKDLCKAFEKLMKDKFQMSPMGELTFFLGLQVKQKQDGIFISQDKYVAEILRKFNLTDGKSASTPIDTEKPLLKDPDGKDVDVHTYRSMISSLMYLTSSRTDIIFAVYACARF